jgi:cysteine desulfurase
MSIPTIYFDNNASTRIDPRVVDAMKDWNDGTLYGNPHAGHFLGDISRKAISHARNQVMKVFGMSEPEWKCVFTSGASESNNMALKGLVFNMARKRIGKPIVIATTEVEHSTIDKCIEWLSQVFDVKTIKLSVDSTGVVNDTFRVFNENPHIDILSCIHCVAETGTVQPILEIGRLFKERFPDSIFHCDASQSVGKIESEVLQSMREVVDMITIAGHKFHGPKGSGALLLRLSITDRVDPLIHGAGQEFGLRGGTENVANIVGLGCACEVATERAELNEPTPMQVLWEAISEELKGGNLEFRTNSLANVQTPYTLNFSVKGMNGPSIVSNLGNAEKKRICFSAGSACHSRGEPTPSKVLTAMGLPKEFASSAVRISLTRGISSDDIREGGRLIGEHIRMTCLGA